VPTYSITFYLHMEISQSAGDSLPVTDWVGLGFSEPQLLRVLDPMPYGDASRALLMGLVPLRDE
jgi:hypothetical protein